MAQRRQRRDRGELADAVLAALAAADRPLTAAEVQADLGGDLAYTTVLTTLTRLREKGAVTRHPAGRAHAYTVTEAPVRAARAMRQALESEADRQSVLARFLEELPPEDVPVLRRLLREAGGE